MSAHLQPGTYSGTHFSSTKMTASLVVAVLLAVTVGSNAQVSSLTIAKRPGVCPRILTFAPCVYKPYQPNQCFHDYQCKVNEKCCSTPCGPRRCKRVIVATPVCPYVTETTCRLKCRERGGLATDKKGCRVCQCARCPRYTPVVACLVDPCRFNKCPRYPQARCVASYCGNCQANFFVNGRKVNCGTTTPPRPVCRRNEEYTRCGGICQPSCGSSVVCRACRPGCSCKRGYIKKTANGRCIRKSRCPKPKCRRHEEYTACGGVCQPYCGSNVQCRAACRPGCSCKTGYIKKSVFGRCIRKTQCPNKRCGRNEVYSTCGGLCQASCGSRVTCAACGPGCACKPGYIRESSRTSRCIRTSRCPRTYPYH
ncbi:uncharacterized protein LOC135819326 [Sycon ciliatum]|uniref:uncharacterized protein LOC135819326 n=1 Tax=Sycon ciliatum TaxID=27933 RepID=UPI0031F6EAFA